MKKQISIVTLKPIVLNLAISTLISTLISISAFADSHKTDYWSVGAFSTAENAIVEKARLVGVTGLPVQIAVFIEGEMALFRLVIQKDSDPAKQKEMLLEAGITPWPIAFDQNQLLEPEATGATLGPDAVVAGGELLADFRL